MKVTVTIVNWSKYQPHQAKKAARPWWFAFTNDILSDLELLNLTDSEFRGWISLLAFASKRKKQTISFRLDEFCQTYRLKPSNLNSLLKKACDFGWITTTVDKLSTDCRQTVEPQYNTIHNKYIVRSDLAPSKDTLKHFDRFWEEFGNKQKKKRSEKLFVRLKSDQIENLFSALSKYKKYLSETGKFQMLPDTWLGEWEDWNIPDNELEKLISKNKSKQQPKKEYHAQEFF